VSEPSYQWGHEHFCEPDTRTLYDTEPRRLSEMGFPVKLEAPPEPPTFCSSCLQWWQEPQPQGSAPRPPESKDNHG
jgi:hypothetical protein